MKTIVYYDCLRSIVLLNFTMNDRALFLVCTEARTRVLREMSEIRLQKNEVGSYAYNEVNTLITQIERVLEWKLFKDSTDGMNVGNALNKYNLTVHIKKIDVLAALRAAAERASTDNRTVKPDIDNNSDVLDKADRQNVFFHAAIGVNKGILEGITKIVGSDITNPILRTTDNSNFKLVDQYHIHQLFTTITEGSERPELSNI